MVQTYSQLSAYRSHVTCVPTFAAAAAAGSTLEGFGIVTLASLLPVLAVELMAIITSLM
jgi:hypothetical protein